jgi:hypothetical protein
MASMSSIELDDHLKVLLLKDLRIQCRARGISPAGSRETLLQSLKENMLQTGDWCGPHLAPNFGPAGLVSVIPCPH